MNETQRRIEAYKKALPGLKERVLAVAVLFVMSAVMLTSVSFAWLTLSRAPEATEISTNVAANGNLEIALSNDNGDIPAESAIGDSFAAEGRNIADANMTWGNLVNLSDPSYGLNGLVLRPAMLNTQSLKDKPLYGAVYSGDGRVEKLDSNYVYTTWIKGTNGLSDYFGVPETGNGNFYGVRAISSAKLKEMEGVYVDTVFVNLVGAAESKNLEAAGAYTNLALNDGYMKSLATVMGAYMTANMNSDETVNNPVVNREDIVNLRAMYVDFLNAYMTEAEAIALNIDLHRYIDNNESLGYINCTVDEVLNLNGKNLTATERGYIQDLNTFRSDYVKIIDSISILDEFINGDASEIRWKDLSPVSGTGLNQVVAKLVNVGACTVENKDVVDPTPISSIGAQAALKFIGKTNTAKITNGILLNFENRTGARLKKDKMSITAHIKRPPLIDMDGTVTANVSTTATLNNYNTNLEAAKARYPQPEAYQAEDTYGLAIDFWVRTNASMSYLTLEGNVLSKTENKEVFATIEPEDAETTEVQLYTYEETIPGGEGAEDFVIAHDVYKYGEKWYSYPEGEPVDGLQDNQTKPKMEEVVTILGYEGENRVWDENLLLSAEDATTQGNGSCYVYYADTPEDQARSLRLLEAMEVAFVDAEGELLAVAKMDTTKYYADSGRVIVPLVVTNDEDKGVNIGTDADGNIMYAITALEQNTPTFITALVYIDGTKLTNQEVLAAADIQGQLNIQFGSSQTMIPIENEKLMDAVRTVTAEIVGNKEFNYDTDTDLTTKVRITIEGDSPTNVNAFFLRQINATQGSREGNISFKEISKGVWEGSYKFTAPGTYVLRTVQLDGTEYVIKNSQQVVVKGFTVSELFCPQATNRNIEVLTADSSYPFDLSIRFASDNVAKMPKSVQGRFLRNDGEGGVNIEFTYDATAGQWKGSGSFLMSGDYTLQYLVLDGQYYDLPTNLHITADISLGMSVSVYTTSPQSFKYDEDDMAENEKKLFMQVVIVDNAGNEITGEENVKIYYKRKGSLATMEGELSWDGTRYYSGDMNNGGVGIWVFDRVTVGNDTINRATTFPTFTIMPSEPPSYSRHQTQQPQTPQYALEGNKASMNIMLNNAGTAKVKAWVVKGTPTADGYAYSEENGTWVYAGMLEPNGEGSINQDGTTTFTFILPEEYQADGYYKITKVEVWNVLEIDESGNQSTSQEDEAMVIDSFVRYVTENNVTNKITDEIVTKVVKTVNVAVSGGVSKEFTGNAVFVTYNYTFGDGEKMILTFTDFEGNSVNTSMIEKVSMTLEYNPANSGTYGGYTIPSGSSAEIIVEERKTISFTVNDTNGKFEQADTISLTYAGDYSITEFKFTAIGQEVTLTGERLPVGLSTYAVKNIAPTVTIDSIAPSGKHNTVNNNKDEIKSVTSEFSTYSAKVYLWAEKSGNSFSINQYPSVTLEIENMGGASKAVMNFYKDGNVTNELHAEGNNNNGIGHYTWNSGTTKLTRYVGSFKAAGTCNGSTVNPAEKLTADTVVLTYDNVDYSFTVTEITIDNPGVD